MMLRRKITNIPKRLKMRKMIMIRRKTKAKPLGLKMPSVEVVPAKIKQITPNAMKKNVEN